MDAVYRFLEVLLMIGVGKLVAIAGLLDDEDAKKLNLFVLYVSSSFLIFNSSLGLGLGVIGSLFLATVIVVLACGVMAYGIGRSLGFERRTLGSLILLGMYPNTLFIGFPVVYAFFGDAGLQLAIIILIAAQFLTPTIFNGVAHYFGKGSALSKAQMAREVLLFPGLVSFAVAISLTYLNIGVPEPVINVSKTVGATTIPLTLISLGIFIKLGEIRKYALLIGVTGFLRLLVSPILAFVVAGAFGIDGLARSVLVLEAAMPPALLNISFAAAKDLDLPATYSGTFTVTVISMFTLLITGFLLLNGPF